MKKTLNSYRKLLRIEQWYKNFLDFATLLFAPETIQPWPLLLLAFFGLCNVSSLTYIANDWLDRGKDRLHPVKKNRPLASGKISSKAALIVASFLAMFTLITAFRIEGLYSFAVLVYFVLTLAYSFGLKNLPLVDIFIIGINFTLRTLAGLLTLPTRFELPYFVFIFAFVLLFLTHKRRSDIKLLGAGKAIAHKPVLKFYTRRVCYGIRALAYMLILAAFHELFLEGWSPYFLLAILALLFYTSTLFVKNPALAIRPHYLFKNKLWIYLLFLCSLFPFLLIV